MEKSKRCDSGCFDEVIKNVRTIRESMRNYFKNLESELSDGVEISENGFFELRDGKGWIWVRSHEETTCLHQW